MGKTEKEALIQEGRNQVLYLLLGIGDEYVAHDNWNPDHAHFLYKVRKMICQRLKTQSWWPERYPDFESYTYTPG